MSDITISTKEPEKAPVQDNDIKEVIRAAQELEKIKKINDEIEQEMKRTDDLLKAKGIMGGRAQAGQYAPEKTQQDKDKEEADKLVQQFR